MYLHSDARLAKVASVSPNQLCFGRGKTILPRGRSHQPFRFGRHLKADSFAYLQYTRYRVANQPDVSLCKTIVRDRNHNLTNCADDSQSHLQKAIQQRSVLYFKNAHSSWTSNLHRIRVQENVDGTNPKGLAWPKRPMTMKPCAGVRLNLY
jgi:hypothetical protein